MKKLVNNVWKYIKNYFTEDDSSVLYITIPRYYKTKKEQNFFIRRTKDFIIENTEVKLNKQK